MFEMRTDSRSTSVTSPLVTRPHHSNLYGRIERLVRFSRAGDASASSYPLHGCLVYWARGLCARGLRPWIAPVGLGNLVLSLK